MIGQAAKLAACALQVVSMGALAQPPPEEAAGETTEAPAWTFAVLKLKYADAEQVAFLLSEVLPPTVRVTAYGPTNSLIIAGDPAIVGEFPEHAASGDVQ